MSGESVNNAELRVDSFFEAEVVGLRLWGTADQRSMVSLGEAVTRAACEARRPGVREVLVDLRELDFMNSSCFKHFVTWICAVDETPAESGPRFRFRSDPKRLWQRRSLHALSSLSQERVVIET